MLIKLIIIKFYFCKINQTYVHFSIRRKFLNKINFADQSKNSSSQNIFNDIFCSFRKDSLWFTVYKSLVSKYH